MADEFRTSFWYFTFRKPYGQGEEPLTPPVDLFWLLSEAILAESPHMICMCFQDYTQSPILYGPAVFDGNIGLHRTHKIAQKISSEAFPTTNRCGISPRTQCSGSQGSQTFSICNKNQKTWAQTSQTYFVETSWPYHSHPTLTLHLLICSFDMCKFAIPEFVPFVLLICVAEISSWVSPSRKIIENSPQLQKMKILRGTSMDLHGPPWASPGTSVDLRGPPWDPRFGMCFNDCQRLFCDF